MLVHVLLLLLEIFAQSHIISVPVDPHPQIIFSFFNSAAISFSFHLGISFCLRVPTISLENKVMVGAYHQGDVEKIFHRM